VDDDGEGGEEALREGRAAVEVGTGLKGLKAGSRGEVEVGSLSEGCVSMGRRRKGERKTHAIRFRNANDRDSLVGVHELRHLDVRPLRTDNKKDVDCGKNRKRASTFKT
jgi:hypothetical protein